MDFIKIIFTIMVSGMAVSIGFALGIVAGAIIGTLCSLWFVVKLFWK